MEKLNDVSWIGLIVKNYNWLIFTGLKSFPIRFDVVSLKR